MHFHYKYIIVDYSNLELTIDYNTIEYIPQLKLLGATCDSNVNFTVQTKSSIHSYKYLLYKRKLLSLPKYYK